MNPPAPPTTRLDVSSLDPRSLFPTQDNISLVAEHARRVQIQLEQDRERVKQSIPTPTTPSSPLPSDAGKISKDLRNQTLNYLSLLNDWLAQANMLLQSRGAPAPRPAPPPVAPMNFSAQVVMEPCTLGDFPCQPNTSTSTNTSITGNTNTAPPVLQARCIVSGQRYYAQVKRLRGTIYGSVHLYQIGRMDSSSGVVRFPHPCEQVAVKSFSKDLVRQRKSREGLSVQEDPMRELAIQQRLSQVGHAFVMPLLACLETDKEFYAVLPYVGGGELFEFVAQRAPLPETEARKLFRNILDGVYYCHCAGVCHRDISLENFLLGGPTSSDPLLIDFGLSVVMDRDGEGTTWKPIPHSGPVGKAFYMAPEVYDVHSQPAGSVSPLGVDGTKVDVWSLGVCLAIMLTGVPLWECASQIDDRFRASIMRRDLPRVLRLWGFELSPQVTNLLQRMLEFSPQDRLSIPQIAQHEWFSMGF